MQGFAEHVVLDPTVFPPTSAAQGTSHRNLVLVGFPLEVALSSDVRELQNELGKQRQLLADVSAKVETLSNATGTQAKATDGSPSGELPASELEGLKRVEEVERLLALDALKAFTMAPALEGWLEINKSNLTRGMTGDLYRILARCYISQSYGSTTEARAALSNAKRLLTEARKYDH